MKIATGRLLHFLTATSYLGAALAAGPEYAQYPVLPPAAAAPFDNGPIDLVRCLGIQYGDLG